MLLSAIQFIKGNIYLFKNDFLFKSAFYSLKEYGWSQNEKRTKNIFKRHVLQMHFSFLKKIYFLQFQLTGFLCCSPPHWEGFSHPRMLSSKLAWNLKMLRSSSIVLKTVEQMQFLLRDFRDGKYLVFHLRTSKYKYAFQHKVRLQEKKNYQA